MNSEKIKPIALGIIELRLPEGIRQAGSYNLLEAFRIILKALLGLVIPN